jgi:hypothetical protein
VEAIQLTKDSSKLDGAKRSNHFFFYMCLQVYPDDLVTLVKRGGRTGSGKQWIGLVKKVHGFVGEQVLG